MMRVLGGKNSYHNNYIIALNIISLTLALCQRTRRALHGNQVHTQSRIGQSKYKEKCVPLYTPSFQHLNYVYSFT